MAHFQTVHPFNFYSCCVQLDRDPSVFCRVFLFLYEFGRTEKHRLEETFLLNFKWNERKGNGWEERTFWNYVDHALIIRSVQPFSCHKENSFIEAIQAQGIPKFL